LVLNCVDLREGGKIHLITNETLDYVEWNWMRVVLEDDPIASPGIQCHTKNGLYGRRAMDEKRPWEKIVEQVDLRTNWSDEAILAEIAALPVLPDEYNEQSDRPPDDSH
jgi:hypothetical protein